MNITKKLIARIAEDICDDPAFDIGWSGAGVMHEVVEHVLNEASAHFKDTEHIVAVVSHTTGNPVLGYATGTEHDIRAYFNDGKGITLQDVEVLAVPSGFAAHRDNIVAKRDRLQAEVDELNRRLKDKDIHKS